MENKTLLLTGSSGFIGRHVLDSLINKGYDVTAIYNSSIPSGFDNVKFVKLNLFDFSAVKEYFENNHFDNLIHLAWYTGKKCHSSNVNIDWVSASLNLLKCFNEQVDNTKTSDNKRKVLMAGTVSEYDFSYGYLNLLKNAKGLCDKLIVGVSVDKLVEYKNKRAVIPFEERIEIVRNIKYVDAAIPQEELDKFKMWEKLHFDVLFVGDDWYNSPSWKEMEEKFKNVGVRVIYFPYTKGTSSTLINDTLLSLRNV